MALSPIEVLNSARKAVPAVDYALGVAGIAAAGAIITSFVGPSKSGAVILGGVLVSMILLYVFSTLLKTDSAYLHPAGIILIYATIGFFICFLCFTISAVAVGWPVPMLKILGLNEEININGADVPRKLNEIVDGEVRVRNVDDFVWVYVNDSAVIDRAVYGEIGGWKPFHRFLRRGTNEIRVVVKNGEYGGCGVDLDVKINNNMIPSLSRSWYLPTERAAVNGQCFDENISFDLK